MAPLIDRQFVLIAATLKIKRNNSIRSSGKIQANFVQLTNLPCNGTIPSTSSTEDEVSWSLFSKFDAYAVFKFSATFSTSAGSMTSTEFDRLKLLYLIEWNFEINLKLWHFWNFFCKFWACWLIIILERCKMFRLSPKFTNFQMNLYLDIIWFYYIFELFFLRFFSLRNFNLILERLGQLCSILRQKSFLYIKFNKFLIVFQWQIFHGNAIVLKFSFSIFYKYCEANCVSTRFQMEH